MAVEQLFVELDTGHAGRHQIAEDDVETLTGSEEPESLVGVCRADDLVLLEDAGHGAQHHFLIVDNQDSAAPFTARGHERRRDRRGPASDGKPDSKDGPFPQAALRSNPATRSSDDAVADRETEPRPLAHRLGREERFEDSTQDLWIHPTPGVLDLDVDAAVFVT